MALPVLAAAARALFARAGGAAAAKGGGQAAAKFGGQAATKQVASGSAQGAAQSLLAPQAASGGGGIGKSITNIFNRTSSSTKNITSGQGQPAAPKPQNLGQLIKPQAPAVQPGGGLFQSIRNTFGGGGSGATFFGGGGGQSPQPGGGQSQPTPANQQPAAPKPQHLGQLVQPQPQAQQTQPSKGGRSVFNRSARVLGRRMLKGKPNWFAPAAKGSAKAGAGVQQRAAMQASGKSMAPKSPRPLSPNIANVKNPGKLMSMMGQPNAVQAAISQQNATGGPSKSGGGGTQFQSKTPIGQGNKGGSGNRPVGGGGGGFDKIIGMLGPFGKGLKATKKLFDKLPAPVKAVVSILVGGAGLLKAVDAWATSLIESKRGLVQFNGQIASAYAKLDAAMWKLNIEKAGATSGTTSALANEIGKFREETKEEMMALTTIVNTISITVVKISRFAVWFAGKVLDPLGVLPAIQRKIEDWFGEKDKDNHAIRFAEEIMKNAGPRPPLPPL